MKTPRALRRMFRRGRAAPWIAAASFLAAATLYTGCEGGSTGVDNPGLTRLPVDFRNEAGNPVQVRGSLEIYGRDHNPALDSAPLLRLLLEADAGVELTPADLDGALAARPSKRSAGTKRAAGAAPAESLVRFNLVFRDGSGSGAAAAGLAYDPALKTFAVESGAERGVRMLPKPLLRFAANLHREGAQGEPGRVILPGTPFLATLVDSGFVLDGLPEGRFPMRLLDGDGYVYAVRESLDTRAGHAFTAEPDPIGRLAADPPVGFGVKTELNVSAYAGQDVPLNGALGGADTSDPRVSIRWRILDKAAGDTAFIADPTRLHTVLRFPAVPGYSLELAATFGAVTVRDTLQIKVSPPPGPYAGKFVYPMAGDTTVQGQNYKVAWEYPASGLVRLEFSPKEGAEGSWSTVMDSLKNATPQTIYAWTTPVLGTSIYHCNLRLIAIPSDSILAVSPSFILKPN